ncbi:hypothetical protein [Chamaesiphon minutus]|uniref:Uncharacterized protein n=1 Tax=Chamaesiphon minutus (strain ATCC 27169 / PCC 6605) TaxID=1173020 RepID=K9UEZ2_CHAP6|nr:hypothetical protein [Chamaesiphon minutus]AFY92759.1 hypothetical protein Cha6605_1607 [Chamaesiphon minutus PCC 6605]
MSDNNVEISERRLQEIGNQLGTPILSTTTHIQVDDESVSSSSQSNADIEGTFDSQPSSKNPLLQYIVAGAIGLGAVGIPLTVLFGLGGTPQTATKPTVPEVEDTSSSETDRELENLKTQSALDIQAKSEPQTVAQTPKPAATTVTTPPKTAPTPKTQPVVRDPAPKPKTIAVQQPAVVAATPATVARPVPIPVTRPVARIVPKPTPAPVAQTQRSTPIAVATQPTQPVTPEQPPLSFEQASALGMFGGDNDKPDDGDLASASGDNSTLTLALPVGANVAAHTVTPYTSLSSRNSATNGTETPLSVQLDQPIQLSQGFNLPAGTIVQFGATVADNGAVSATSKGVFIDGTEIKVPVGAFALTANNSAALVANQRSLREGELSGADINAAMWGAAGSVGKALVDSGTTSVINTSGLGTSVVQTNNGNVNIPGAVLQGAFSPLAKAKADRANALAQELQQSSRLNEIPVRSPVRVFVAAAATVQVPVGSDVNAAAGTPEQGQVLGGGEVEQPPTMIPAKPISANNVQPVVAPPTTTANVQPVIAPAPVTATAQPTFTPQLPITPTTQPTQGINTPSPIAPTKPNNVINTRSNVVPQSVTTPTQLIQTPAVTTPQPIVTAPAPTTLSQPATITQPSVVPQQPVQQPSITTSEREARHQGGRLPSVGSPTTFIPPQPIPSTTTQTAPIPTQPAPIPVQPTGATTITTPIAPTKPNTIDTQPRFRKADATRTSVPTQSNSGIDAQSPPIVTPTQLTEAQNTPDPAPAITQTTTGGTQSGLIPIQFDNGGNIQPATTPNPAMAPLP